MAKTRKAVARDADTLGRIMFDAIHSGHSAYTPAQRKAWLDAPRSGPDWAAHLFAQKVWVAEIDNQPVGFITLGAEGYVDLAFVAAVAQGRGVFSALAQALENEARQIGLRRLWTHASLMAQPAFEARGFHAIRHETVARSGETLARTEMEKMLT